MVELTYTAKRIAEIMGKSTRAIEIKAKKESWPFIETNGKGRGGKRKKYPLTALPSAVQTSIIVKEGCPADMIQHLAPEAALAAMEKHMPVQTFEEACSPSAKSSPSPSPSRQGRGVKCGTSRQGRGVSLPPGDDRRGSTPPGDSTLLENTPAVFSSINPPVSPFRKGGIEEKGCNLPQSIYEQEGMYPAVRYEYEKLPAWSPERAISADALRDPRIAHILEILREVEAIPRDWDRGKRKWVECVALKNSVQWQSVYRWIKKYDKRGIAGIEHRNKSLGKPKAWTPEALDWWIGLCLKPEHRHIDRACLYRDILIIEAYRRNWKIGGEASANWWFDKKATPQLLALQKGGMRALDNVLPPILRDYSDLAPFEMLVGDQHRFDFWVVDDDTGKVFRPEGFFWQDLRTRLIYGAAFDHHYDAHLCGVALRIGIRIWGCCNAIYTDNGAPELSKYMMGIMSEIRAMGMAWEMTLETPMDVLDVDGEEVNPVVSIEPGTHKKAVVKNAKAKMIEGTFAIMEGILRSVFRVSGSVKRLSDDIHSQDVDHAEAMKLAADGKLLLASEFYLTVYRAIDYYNREKVHRGVRREWIWKPTPPAATPLDCLKACYQDGWRPRVVTNEAADLIFLKRASRVVQLGRITIDNETYEHDALLELHGQRVECRYHQMERDVVLVYEGAKFLCPAFPLEYSSMKDDDLARRKIMEKRAKRKAIAEQFRAITKQIPDFREYSQVPEAERIAAVVGDEKKRIEATRAALMKPLSAEELEIEVAKLEELNRRLPDGSTLAMPKRIKALPPRPNYWANDTDRYFWCLKTEIAGGALCEEDQAFVKAEEAKMTPEARDRWQFEREYGEG